MEPATFPIGRRSCLTMDQRWRSREAHELSFVHEDSIEENAVEDEYELQMDRPIPEYPGQLRI